MRNTILALVLLALAGSACRPSEAEVLDRDGASAAPEEETPRLRRVWAAAGDYATPSPDGRLIAFVDWTTGDVAVHDLATAESRRITDKGTWTENGSWAEFPIFSADGKKVVYAYGNVLTGNPFRYELRWVELGDTTQHLVRAIGESEDWIAPLDWSERGILFTHYTTPERSTLGILDPATGDVEMLEPEFGRGRGSGREARFSPDGRYAAYWMAGGLKVRDLERGTVSPIAVPTTSLIDWAADGGALLVHSARDGRAGLWLIPVSGGRQAGEPKLVRDGIPAVVQGGARAGEAFYYSIPADAPRLHLASLDIQRRRLLSAPTAITTPMDGGAMLPAWSPDGTQLAYLLRPLNGQGAVRLMVRQATGDGLRELATLDLGRIASMAWAPDGREILVLQRATRDLLGVSVQDGTVRKVVTGLGDVAAISPDGRTAVAIVEQRTGRDDVPSLVAVDVASGERRILDRAEAGAPGAVSFSPDGQTLAYVRGAEGQGPSEIRLLPLAGGASRTVLRLEYPRHLERERGPLAWSPDGKHLLAAAGAWEAEGSHDLFAVSIEDGDIQPFGLTDFPGGGGYFSLHPQGGRLAFVSGQPRTELWVLDRLED